MSTTPQARLALVAVLLLCVLVASQAAVTALVPSGSRSDTRQVLSQTGFAYLGGLRTFAAAVLWNRIEPVFHEYYQGMPLSEQKFALPTMRIVTLLDPQFEQAYYVAAYEVAAAGDMEEGLVIAREGVTNNPDSGLMRSNLAQLLMMQNREANLPEMLALAQSGVLPSTRWSTVDDEYDGLVVFRTVFHLAGDQGQAALIEQRLSELSSSAEFGTSADHDHDGDGVQDH
jgi:hypothetical protein